MKNSEVNFNRVCVCVYLHVYAYACIATQHMQGL